MSLPITSALSSLKPRPSLPNSPAAGLSGPANQGPSETFSPAPNLPTAPTSLTDFLQQQIRNYPRDNSLLVFPKAPIGHPDLNTEGPNEPGSLDIGPASPKPLKMEIGAEDLCIMSDLGRLQNLERSAMGTGLLHNEDQVAFTSGGYLVQLDHNFLSPRT